jgi:hypothetical protein
MDTSASLSELFGLSTQVVEAVVAGPSGEVEAARTSSDGRARTLAGVGSELLAAGDTICSEKAVERVQVDLASGSLVALTDGTRTVVATTIARPTTALVAHDLRPTLGRIGSGAPR